jgi:GWxTD domain-containing protein
MRQTIFALLLLTLITPAAIGASDPATALTEAKRSIAAKDFRGAVDALTPAVAGAGQLAEPQRSQALAALHFYSAVAQSALRDDAKARMHLAEYLRLSPNSRRIDASKYDPRFVGLFRDMAMADQDDSGTTFGALYPGYGSMQASVPAAERGTWGASPAIALLASSAERRAWEALVSIDDREKFVADFWLKRDRAPETAENEFRQEFERRVAFADQVFASREARGSMSDRGKVFVLLGEPAFVRRRPITPSDRVRLVEEAIDIVNGTMENWVYSREQLPAGAITQPTVMYRFVTQQGIGNAVLQQDRAIGKHVLNGAKGAADTQ